MSKPYLHLDLEERRKIARWHEAKVPATEIAARLGRHRSTIFRELSRNRFVDAELRYLSGYYALNAQNLAAERRANQRKLIQHPKLRAAVIDRLQSGWTPEQIAGRLRLERAPQRVSHETIYQYIYSKDGHAIQLWRHLPDHRRKRRGRGRRRPQHPRFAEELSIRHRPGAVTERSNFGDWEADLIQFRKEFGATNLTSLVERVSRFTVLLKNPDRRSRLVMDGVINSLAPLPAHARRSITFDRGLKFWPGPTCNQVSASQPGFVTRNRPGRKARSRIPMAGSGAGCRATSIPRPSTAARSSPSVTGSMPRRGSASAIAHPPRSSARN